MAEKSTKANEYESLNIYQKLAKIRKNLEVIQKDSSGFGYKYVSEAEILSKLSVWLTKMGLLLIPRIDQSLVETQLWDMEQTRKGNLEKKCEVVVSGPLTFTWINAANPSESLEVPWFFAGQQADASQAFGSGLTYCTRYFLLKFFNIATTEDDPDNWRTKQQAAAKEEDVMLAKATTKVIDEVAKKFVADSDDADKAKAELMQIVKKYVKSGNYLKIEEPALATKLLQEVKELANAQKGGK